MHDNMVLRDFAHMWVQVTMEQRNHAKAMAYGLLYGLGKDRLATRMGVNPQEAAQKSTDFRASIPVLVRPTPHSLSCP